MKLKNKDGKEIVVDYNAIEKVRLAARAMKNPLRKKLLTTISDYGEIRVTDLYKKMKIEQSVTSAHLGILRREKIVTVRKEGKERIYSVNVATLNCMNVQFSEYAKTLTA